MFVYVCMYVLVNVHIYIHTYNYFLFFLLLKEYHLCKHIGYARDNIHGGN